MNYYQNLLIFLITQLFSLIKELIILLYKNLYHQFILQIQDLHLNFVKIEVFLFIIYTTFNLLFHIKFLLMQMVNLHLFVIMENLYNIQLNFLLNICKKYVVFTYR